MVMLAMLLLLRMRNTAPAQPRPKQIREYEHGRDALLPLLPPRLPKDSIHARVLMMRLFVTE